MLGLWLALALGIYLYISSTRSIAREYREQEARFVASVGYEPIEPASGVKVVWIRLLGLAGAVSLFLLLGFPTLRLLFANLLITASGQTW